MSLASRLLGANPSVQVSSLLTGAITTPSAKTTISTSVTLHYLVVAGGGGGGQGYSGGGGGAGGLRSTVTATGGGGTLELSLIHI